MAVKKPKKKSIDGVVKVKKPAAETILEDLALESDAPIEETIVEDAIIRNPESPEEGEDIDSADDNSGTISVSVNDTSITIETDESESPADLADGEYTDDEHTSDEYPNDTTADEPETATRQISEPAVEDDIAKDIGLVSSAILEDEVIDKNLDDIINDIENDELSSENQKKSPKNDLKNELTSDESFEQNLNKEEEKPVTKSNKFEKSSKNSKDAKPFRIISRIITIASAAAVAALGVRIATTGIVPNKYLIPGLIVAAIVLIFFIFKSFRKKTHIWALVIFDLISVLLAAVSIFGFVKIDETMSFLNKNFGEDIEYSIYDVIVSKKSNYNSLDDVKGKTFHSISDFVDTERLEKAAKDQANATISYEDGITSLLEKTIDDTTYIAVINSGTYEGTLEGDETNTYSDSLKIIGELKVEVEKKNKSSSNLTDESFVLYISGIDTRSGLMLDRSLSDVNIVVAVNPKTKNILMVSIPRDYYVQLHGTSGLPDKLTHAGSLGGVQLSMSTIGDLLDVDFARYIRVNFNFVVNLVDAIGGITVYSDVDYTFTTLHPENKKCTFVPGNNEVDGACALGFSRERYAYSDGDRHRGRNQEQVIEKILDKVTSSSTLISRYSSILDSLEGSFDTDISTKDITSFVNMQLSDMSKWTVNSYNLNGTTGPAYTYSYPSQPLSVMFPDESTVDTAKQKIQQVLSGAVLEPATE